MTLVTNAPKLATDLIAALALTAGTASADRGPIISAGNGHDDYFILNTSGTYIKFLVLATLDIRIDGP
jgi:hypothetical protein